MPNFGIWRIDPPPQQGQKHVPIATGGNQPPFIGRQVASLAAVIALSWPATGEPHPIQPFQGRSQIAPLTQTYKDQPPRRDALNQQVLRSISQQWQVLWNPPQKLVSIAPLTLTYGNQPRPLAYQPYLLNQYNNVWQVIWPAQGWTKIGPLVQRYGDQPQLGPSNPTQLYQYNQSWQITWPAQSEPENASWNVIVIGYVPYTDVAKFTQYNQSWQTSWPSQAGSKIVPLTLSYGNQFPFISPVSNFALYNNLWQIDWRSQHSAIIAPLSLSYGDQPPPPTHANDLAQYNRVWQTDWKAQRSAQIIPLTLSYGDNPQPIRPLLGLWKADTWNSQRSPFIIPVSAIEQFPIPVSPSLLSQYILAWQEDWGSQRAAPVAPLVLTYGDQPQQSKNLLDQYVRSWIIDWPSQHGSILVPISEFVPPSLNLYPQYVRAWQVDWSSQTPSRIAPLIPIVITQIPTLDRYRNLIIQIDGSWIVNWDAQHAKYIAHVLAENPALIYTGQFYPSSDYY